MKRLGLIVRSDFGGGLANQSWEMYRHLEPDATLVVLMGERGRGTPERCERYDPAYAVYYLQGGTRHEATIEEFLSKIDVVCSVETFYEPTLVARAQQMGIERVLYANAELLSASDPAERADRYLYPASWGQPFPQPGEILPWPCSTDVTPRQEINWPPRFVHVGAPAFHDRNGTEVVDAAEHLVTEPLELVAYGQRLPPEPATFMVHRDPVDDHWDLYRDADVLVLPRRYGCLCLERGTLVGTPEGRVPIENLRAGDRVLDDDGVTTVTGVGDRSVDERVTISARGRTLVSSVDHVHLAADSPTSDLREVKAGELELSQWLLLPKPPPSGQTRVVVGPRPVRKGLRVWYPEVELDHGWMRLIGLWLAEGFSYKYSRRGRTHQKTLAVWCFGPHEHELAQEVCDLLAERGLRGTAIEHHSEGSFGKGDTLLVRCHNLWFYEFLEALKLGHGAHNKRAPDVAAHLVPGLVGGWIDGDGCSVGSTVSGFSRSTAMITDFAHLLAKVGICGSISNRGQQLSVSWRGENHTVAAWTKRLTVKHEYTNRAPRANRWMRPHPRGWLVQIRSILREATPTEVVSIETESHRYIANGLLTHNSLTMLEAAAMGVPTLTTDLLPQRGWFAKWAPWLLIPAGDPKLVSMKGSQQHLGEPGVGVHQPHPANLALAMDRLAARADVLDALRVEVREWAEARSWEKLLPEWEAALR